MKTGRVNHKSSGASEPFTNRMRASVLKEESTMKENANSKLSKSLCRSAIAIVAIGIAAAPAIHVADTLTLFGTLDAGTASGSSPKEIRSLSGVTASMTDKARGLIYATNGDGLWIVKTKQRVEADAPPPDYYGGGG
jgi:hypothetical protein